MSFTVVHLVYLLCKSFFFLEQQTEDTTREAMDRPTDEHAECVADVVGFDNQAMRDSSGTTLGDLEGQTWNNRWKIVVDNHRRVWYDGKMDQATQTPLHHRQ
jgi:hypothetical protein